MDYSSGAGAEPRFGFQTGQVRFSVYNHFNGLTLRWGKRGEVGVPALLGSNYGDDSSLGSIL